MKTIKLTVATALIALAVSTAAVERPKINFAPVNSGQAILSVSNEKATDMELSIFTSSGDLVYYKQTNEQLKDYNKIYDFKNLALGKYTLSLKINGTRIANDFEVTGKGITVGERKVSYDPYFNFENDELRFSYLNFDQQNMKLFIYKDSRLVFKKNLGRDFNITSGFNLAKLEEGAYNILLYSHGKEYSYNIVK